MVLFLQPQQVDVGSEYSYLEEGYVPYTQVRLKHTLTLICFFLAASKVQLKSSYLACNHLMSAKNVHTAILFKVAECCR